LAALTAAMGALAGPAAAADGTIRSNPDAKAIPDRYIVVLKDDAVAREATTRTADDLVQRSGGSVRSVWQHALQGFAISASEASARAIAGDPRVDYVEQDIEVREAAKQFVGWGPGNLDRIDDRTGGFDGGYSYLGSAARDVHAYVIDSGIRLTHSEFGGRASWGVNTIDTTDTDCRGHGTHVAGTLGGNFFGVAKQVRLVAVKVLNCNGNGSAASVIGGVDWVTANATRPAVANMSLGSGANTAVDTAVRNSINSGISYSVASGNGDFFGNPQDACTKSPARVAEAITVNAASTAETAASFSNYGICTDLWAPGVSVWSASHESDTASAFKDGTSMASPHVAGVAALYLQRHPAATPAQVQNAIRKNATPDAIEWVAGTPTSRLYSLFTRSHPQGDYNDDQRTDLTVWRPSTGQWFVNGVSTTAWGVSGDIPVPGDYNGDGITDKAVWRPSTGQWFVHGISTTAWGVSGDVPVPGDYNGDGITDKAVWRPSTGQWFIHGFGNVAWGVSGDVPVPGDYNGDGITEKAVWRPSTGQWLVFGIGGATTAWGVTGDKPVPGDYNGDGITDKAVWRPSTGQWFVHGISTTAWGVSGDKPVPGDYNGDGITDKAVWRPSTGQWFVHGISTTAWGQNGDVPLGS
jgi:subtilisin family serine protease